MNSMSCNYYYNHIIKIVNVFLLSPSINLITPSKAPNKEAAVTALN